MLAIGYLLNEGEESRIPTLVGLSRTCATHPGARFHSEAQSPHANARFKEKI